MSKCRGPGGAGEAEIYEIRMRVRRGEAVGITPLSVHGGLEHGGGLQGKKDMVSKRGKGMDGLENGMLPWLSFGHSGLLWGVLDGGRKEGEGGSSLTQVRPLHPRLEPRKNEMRISHTSGMSRWVLLATGTCSLAAWRVDVDVDVEHHARVRD